MADRDYMRKVMGDKNTSVVHFCKSCQQTLQTNERTVTGMASQTAEIICDVCICVFFIGMFIYAIVNMDD